MSRSSNGANGEYNNNHIKLCQKNEKKNQMAMFVFGRYLSKPDVPFVH